MTQWKLAEFAVPGANQRVMRNATLDPGFRGSRLSLALIKNVVERPIKRAWIILLLVAS